MAQIGFARCAISEITLLELLYGAEYGTEPAVGVSLVQALVDKLRLIPVLEAATRFAQEKARLRRAGLLIPDFDLLIGVTAVAEQRTLVTGNGRHLGRIQGIALEDWTLPENVVGGAQASLG